MAGLKWLSILAVSVVIIGAIQLAGAAPVDNSLDDLNPLSYEVRTGLGNGQFQIPISDSIYLVFCYWCPCPTMIMTTGFYDGVAFCVTGVSIRATPKSVRRIY